MKCAALKVTDYERPILVLMARGYTPKQIAAALGLSAPSVCNARRRVFKRNGISNDTQLGILIGEQQFVSVDERNRIEDRREERIDSQRTQGVQ
jgi:DNA-binding CsgD family transcriptional regulator